MIKGHKRFYVYEVRQLATSAAFATTRDQLKQCEGKTNVSIDQRASCNAIIKHSHSRKLRTSAARQKQPPSG